MQIPSADATLRIDAQGLLCPLPVLKLRKALRDLAPGAQVQLLATDPAAVIDVPHFCQQGGHELLSVEPSENGARLFTVRRG
ncbi:sulfurtransferase TusA family protein [Paracoccus sp. Z118]|uniref:sulfurtransferase TusA family protein n=1 Tax=Paracoccus sp. Z118 TaxID=2851017 RepID=UPI001C2BCB44|nr:sulfurtransferase TusA family protein [Paracoccus sp. Z118]MBV0890746.1 sulfurtransferase TusA family protein [Paracoccus sp. Z118]